MSSAISTAGRWAVPVFFSMVLGACGGGGGGGSAGGGGGGTSDTAFSAVSISLKSPSTIRDVTYAGLPIHPAELEIGYSGDVSALAGRTIYAKIVHPEGLYVADPSVSTGAGQSVFVSLHANDARLPAAGRATGTMQLHACLDPNCATELQNSPLAVDYDVEIRPGLTVSTELLQQSSNYGATVAPATVTVSSPAEDGSWFIVPIGEVAGANSASLAVVPGWLQRTGNILTFQPPDNLLPGVYAVDFQLDTALPDAKFPGTPVRLVRKLRVSHTVVATGIYAMNPTSENLTISLSGLNPGSVIPQLVSQVGGYFARVGVRTDAYPPAATGNPMLANWLALSSSPDLGSASHVINYCDPVARTCLPTGTYRGAVVMRHIDSRGVQTDFDFPVNVTLTP